MSFGPKGLELLRKGVSPAPALKQLTAKDPMKSRRQVGIVALNGASATYTGIEANAWAGGRRGPNYAVQGNILTGPEVVEAMEKAFIDGDLDPLRKDAEFNEVVR